MLGWDQLPLFAGSGDSQPNKQQVCRANRAFDEQRGETLYGAIHEIHRYLGKIQPLLFGSQQLSFPSASPSASKCGLTACHTGSLVWQLSDRSDEPGGRRLADNMILSLLLLLVLGLVATFVFHVVQHRLYIRSLPGPPGHSLLFAQLSERYRQQCTRQRTQIDDQIAVPPSLDKWGSLRDTFAPFMDDKNLLPMEGKMWKHLRSLFNPGFSASNMLTHVPAIERETQQLCANLQERAAKGEAFQMEPLTTNLTVQVIGNVVL
ncbi:hypothetical protein IWZ03DRAFT_3465 [Phyllosticta citriasiana]|uniref:Uncharacterized protein n=1 Tax=Phyllosticta citriasiana TaxID=595635 RepID=A0ABR1KYL4_9PEZI